MKPGSHSVRLLKLFRILCKAAPVCAMPIRPAVGRSVPVRFYGMIESKSYIRKGNNWYLGGKRVTGAKLADIKKMAVPPGWSKVHVAVSPRDKLQVVGLDKAGRTVRRYSDKFTAIKKQQKFVRVRQFSRDLPAARKGMMASDAPANMLLRIEDKTAMRIGGTKDLKAKVKSYGLTTLEGRHINITGSTINFDYIAKEGIRQQKSIQDVALAKWLRARKAKAGAAGKLFPDVSATKLNAQLKKLSGSSYSLKDVRTFHATNKAHAKLVGYENTVLTTQQRKQIVKDVTEDVSKFLGNTPTMAKNSYIDPQVWSLIGGLP